jgi:hypothetical protein
MSASAPFRRFVRSLSLFAALTLAVAPRTQDAKPAPTPAPAAQAPAVEVPAFPNATCPIMGKKASAVLSVDTDLGRFYVCCKPCFKKVLADVPKAHQTAYPVVEEHKNTTCPVSGRAVGKDAVAVTLQGHRFQVCCQDCVPSAQKQSQPTLTKLLKPGAVDVGNTVCPVSGEAVDGNAIVLVDGAIVRLASHKHVEAVKQAPATMLERARSNAKPPAKPSDAPRAPEAGK